MLIVYPSAHNVSKFTSTHLSIINSTWKELVLMRRKWFPEAESSNLSSCGNQVHYRDLSSTGSAGWGFLEETGLNVGVCLLAMIHFQPDCQSICTPKLWVWEYFSFHAVVIGSGIFHVTSPEYHQLSSTYLPSLWGWIALIFIHQSSIIRVYTVFIGVVPVLVTFTLTINRMVERSSWRRMWESAREKL